MIACAQSFSLGENIPLTRRGPPGGKDVHMGCVSAMLAVSMCMFVHMKLDLKQPMRLLNRPLMIQEATRQHMHYHVLLIHSSGCVQVTLSHSLAGAACGCHESFWVSSMLYATACLYHGSVTHVGCNSRQATGRKEVKLKGGVEITPFGFGCFVRMRKLLLSLLACLLGQKHTVDVRQHTTSCDGHASQQLAQLLIVANCQLDVAGHNASLLVVTSSVAC